MMEEHLALELIKAMHQFKKLKMHKLIGSYTNREEQVMVSIARAKMITKKEAVPVSFICQHMKMSPAAASRIFRSLEEKGIILRKSSDEDKRTTLLAFTEYGMEQCEIIHQKGKEFWVNILDQVGEERVLEMVDLLNEIYEIAEKELDNMIEE